MGSRKGRSSYKRKTRFAPKAIPTSITIKSPSGMPDVLHVKLRYVQQVGLTDAVGGIQKFNTWSGNSPFDPDVTGSGHQPLAYDQWAALYLRQRTIASSIHVRVWNNTSNVAVSQANFKVVMVPTTTPATLTGLSSGGGIATGAWREQRYSKEASIHGSTAFTQMSHYMTTSKIWSTPKRAVIDTDTFSSLTSANPASPWYWVVGMVPVDGSATWGSFMEVTIMYYVRFEEPIILAQS